MYLQTCGELVVYMPHDMPPAKMAPACAMNHSGALNPMMPTVWCLARPSFMKALAAILASSRYWGAIQLKMVLLEFWIEKILLEFFHLRLRLPRITKNFKQ